MKRAVAAILVAIALSGCASSEPPRPSTLTTPLKGQSAEQHARDTNDCQFVAKQQTGYDPAMDTAKGAATGNAGTGAAIGAATGAVGGAAVGGGYKYSKSKEGYEQAYATCMSHKGYQVR
jgi:hypothetical protein